MEKLFGITGVEMVIVDLENTFTDAYGQEEKERAVSLTITKETADKINWENINASNRAGLLRVADDFYIHPGILKNIDNEDIAQAIAVQAIK